MGYIYKNKDYYNAINDYKNGDDSALKIELKFLSRRDIPEYDKDSFYFINEALKLAKIRNDKDTVVLLTEFSRQMDLTGTSNFMHSAVLTDALETEQDCLDALKECLKNGQYEVVLSNIVNYIRGNGDFHVALKVVKEIIKTELILDDEKRVSIAKYFIQRMDDAIKLDIKPKPICKSFWGYKSNLYKFKNDDYVHYKDFVTRLEKKIKRGKI